MTSKRKLAEQAQPPLKRQLFEPEAKSVADLDKLIASSFSGVYFRMQPKAEALTKAGFLPFVLLHKVGDFAYNKWLYLRCEMLDDSDWTLLELLRLRNNANDEAPYCDHPSEEPKANEFVLKQVKKILVGVDTADPFEFTMKTTVGGFFWQVFEHLEQKMDTNPQLGELIEQPSDLPENSSAFKCEKPSVVIEIIALKAVSE